MESLERKQKKQRKHDEDTPIKRKKLTKERESFLEEDDTSMKKKKKKLTEESSTPLAESSAKKRSTKHEEGTPVKGKKLTKEHEASQEEEDPPLKKKKQKLMKESIEEISIPIQEISAKKKRKTQGLTKEKSSAEKELAMKKLKEKQKEKQKKRKKRLKEKLDSTVNEKITCPEEDPQSDVSAREKRRDMAMNVFFRLLVPSKDLGKVIGEHGSRVQQLREQTGARIKIGDAIMNLDERVIWVSSKEDSLESQSAAERALLRVATLLGEPENEDLAKTRLLIAGSQAGSVVGKDGVAIDKLKKNTGAIVQVLTKERFPLLAYASETDRLVQLEGKVSQVLKALELIAVKLRKSPPRKRDVKGRKASIKGGAFKSSVQIRIPKDLIGKVIGKEGATIWQMRQQCGVSIEVDELKDGAQERTVHIKGALSQVTMAQTLLQVFLASKKKTQ